MNAGAYFQQVARLPVGTWQELTGGKPFVVLSPHPDDESLGAGGLIALARQHEQEAYVVLLSDGSMSHPNSKSYPGHRLIALRRAELVAAARALGLAPRSLIELGFPDTRVPKTGPDFEKALDNISDLIVSTGSESLFVTWVHDPHCDHEAAAYLAERLRRRHSQLRLWSYPIWGWHLPSEHQIKAPEPSGIRLNIESVLDLKRSAIAAHVSQMTDLIDDDPDCFRFTESTLAPFLSPHEVYIEVPYR